MNTIPDEQMLNLQRSYRASFPGKANDLWQSLMQFEARPQDDSLQALRMVLHRLAGSAALYGFPEIGQLAREAIDVLDKLQGPFPIPLIADLHEATVVVVEALRRESE